MEIEGMQNVPKGRALIVGNHNSGITFIEPIAIGTQWYLERGTDDALLWLVHDAMLAMPGLKNFLVRAGCARASHKTANAALDQGRKVVVFPGGNLDAFRTYRNRYKITFGGHKGFVRLALKRQVPIVPMVIAGGHESFFVLNSGRTLARLLRLNKTIRSDTFPIFLGLPWGIGVGPIFHIPLPAKSHVRFLDPISINGYRPKDAKDPDAIDDMYLKVTGAMQCAMDDIAAARKYPIIG
jgi:1-acyl-sn-glycerol-3-phosphate acyltransferase